MAGTAAPTIAPVSFLFRPAIFSPAIAPKIFANIGHSSWLNVIADQANGIPSGSTG